MPEPDPLAPKRILCCQMLGALMADVDHLTPADLMLFGKRLTTLSVITAGTRSDPLPAAVIAGIVRIHKQALGVFEL